MAAIQRKLVHKQFNSPMGLYSDANVKETLDRELRAFNGAVGIETSDQRTANLANSAVLKMLEEQEGERFSGYKRVAWPPESDGTSPVKGSTPQPQQQPQYQPQSQQSYQSPVSHQPSYGQQQQQPQQQYNQPQQQYYSQGQQPQYQQQQFDRGQSPGIIHLRKEAPVSQKPAPVVTSQPAAKEFRGGSNMRGDLKWPPPDVKAQMDAEEQQRRMLAVGPSCRPRRVNKDYTKFFAKHALNSTYPGYKVPPGTQHMYAEY